MQIIKFIFEIIKKYIGLIIVLILMYIIHRSYIALDSVSIRGGYFILYETLGKALNFLFDRVPKIFIQIPHFKIPKFGFLLKKIPKIPEVPQVRIPRINHPGDCGVPFPNPKGLVGCVFEGGKYVAKGVSKVIGAVGGLFCISEDSVILMSDYMRSLP